MPARPAPIESLVEAPASVAEPASASTEATSASRSAIPSTAPRDATTDGPGASWRPVAAAVVSGALLAAAYALEPWWWAAWLASGPLLWAAWSTGWRMSLAAGAIAGTIGSLSLVGYLAGLAGPIDAACLSLSRTAQWAAIAGTAWHTWRRLPRWAAVGAPAALAAGLEPLTAALSPHGSAGTIALSQMEVAPALQAASIGGTAAIAGLLMLPATALTAALAGRRQGGTATAATAALAIAGLALGAGAWRAAEPSAPTPHAPTIALLATDRFARIPDDWQSVWDAYRPAVEAAAAERGAEIVVLPEKLAAIEVALVEQLLDQVAATASASGATIVLGLDVRDEEDRNRLFAVSPSGEVAVYDKRHLVPGLEARFTPGSEPAHTSAARLTAGLAICKDMDFPATIREASAGVDAMLVPAWDFGQDRWMHSRLAVLRGVETGVPVARAAREGYLTLADQHGRIVAEASSGAPEVMHGIALVTGRLPAPTPTPYAAIGDLLGWSAFGAAGLALAGAVLAPRRGRRVRRDEARLECRTRRKRRRPRS